MSTIFPGTPAAVAQSLSHLHRRVQLSLLVALSAFDVLLSLVLLAALRGSFPAGGSMILFVGCAAYTSVLPGLWVAFARGRGAQRRSLLRD